MIGEPMISLRLTPPGRRRRGVISVTVPSRGRAAKLTASMQSLLNTAKRPDLIEFLVAHDPDDPATVVAAFGMNADVIWEAPERYGYARSAHYWAALLEKSTGEWVLPTWSDDALMKTGGWDDLLRAQIPGSVAFLDGNYPGLTCFPAVHADALSAIGRLAPLPALDTWFEDAARDAGVLVHPGIYVHQDRPDITGCPPDATYNEGGGAWRAAAGHVSFYAEPYATWRAEDSAAMRRLWDLEDVYQSRLVPWSDIQEQMPLLRDAARRYSRPVIGELGSRSGESTSALLSGAAATGGHVWSIDCGPTNTQWATSGLWSFLPADDMSANALAWMPAELDVLFIDTSHRYDHTLAELRAYAPRVKPGGVILMHDVELTIGQMIQYGEPGAADDADGPEYPVAAALDVYCKETGLSWTRQHRSATPPEPSRTFFGLGTIEKTP